MKTNHSLGWTVLYLFCKPGRIQMAGSQTVYLKSRWLLTISRLFYFQSEIFGLLIPGD